MDSTACLSAVAHGDLVLVAVSPSRYQGLLPRLLPFIHSGQHILFFPACFGGMIFRHILEKAGIANVVVAESVSFPYVCDRKDVNRLFVHGIKRRLQIAICPSAAAETSLAFYNHYFDIFRPAGDILETSLDNINMVLHPAPILLNVGAVEQDSCSFRHYIDGVTPAVGRVMELIDQERLALGVALGLHLTPTLAQLKAYYGDSPAATIFDYVAAPDGPYEKVRGFGFNSRYITEDIPCLLLPTLLIAGQAGVSMPTTEICLKLAEKMLGMDYSRVGFSLELLGYTEPAPFSVSC